MAATRRVCDTDSPCPALQIDLALVDGMRPGHPIEESLPAQWSFARPPTVGAAMTFADDAIAWFDQNARDLPWRQPTTSPWGVLVSEVMLQQTPVVRVEPAWRSWMTRCPPPADLAADPPSEAIRMWGRLGYPRRAMRLHACAVAIVERHGGVVPDDLDQLLALPGVGTYTARAVATFAYGQRHPVVDTNVRRVV